MKIAAAVLLSIGLGFVGEANTARAADWSIGVSVGLPGVVVVPPANVPPPRYYVPAYPPGGNAAPPYYGGYIRVPYGRYCPPTWQGDDEDDDDD